MGVVNLSDAMLIPNQEEVLKLCLNFVLVTAGLPTHGRSSSGGRRCQETW